MISEVYPNKHQSACKRYPTVTYVPPSHGNWQHNNKGYTGQQQQHPTQSALSIAAMRAAKLGISTAEWQRRDELVKKLAAECKMNFMDTFYPSIYDEWVKRGKCVYLGKPASYSEIDADLWPANDNVLVFSARSLDGDTTPFVCNFKFMTPEVPVES